MNKIVRVSIRPYRVPKFYTVGDLEIEKGEWVVVPEPHGIEVGEVIERPINIDLPQEKLPPEILRLASTEEIERYFENLEQEKDAWRFCADRARHYNLAMKLVRVERQFDGKKITFYYFAENRIDFRELVKDLVRGLRTRVEMRQIGVRHEAKMIGGIGCCGRELCCATFINEFAPVSIKMAKAQNLPLNPNKISGICGRLLCCLTYEYETYKDLQAELPSLGKFIELGEGEAKVIRQNVLKSTVTVLMPDGEEVELPVGEDGEVETEMVITATSEDIQESLWDEDTESAGPSIENGTAKEPSGQGTSKRQKNGGKSSGTRAKKRGKKKRRGGRSQRQKGERANNKRRSRRKDENGKKNN